MKQGWRKSRDIFLCFFYVSLVGDLGWVGLGMLVAVS